MQIVCNDRNESTKCTLNGVAVSFPRSFFQVKHYLRDVPSFQTQPATGSHYIEQCVVWNAVLWSWLEERIFEIREPVIIFGRLS